MTQSTVSPLSPLSPLATHSLSYRVYYRDSDAAGVMYYARYADLFEVARMELFDSLGIDVADLHRDLHIVFPVRHLTIDYKQPAYLGELLTLEIDLVYVGRSRIDCDYRIKKEGRKSGDANQDEGVIAFGKTVNVCVSLEKMNVVKLPEEIKNKLSLK